MGVEVEEPVWSIARLKFALDVFDDVLSVAREYGASTGIRGVQPFLGGEHAGYRARRDIYLEIARCLK
jgi:hypothetical protein